MILENYKRKIEGKFQHEKFCMNFIPKSVTKLKWNWEWSFWQKKVENKKCKIKTNWERESGHIEKIKLVLTLDYKIGIEPYRMIGRIKLQPNQAVI